MSPVSPLTCKLACSCEEHRCTQGLLNAIGLKLVLDKEENSNNLSLFGACQTHTVTKCHLGMSVSRLDYFVIYSSNIFNYWIIST